MGAAANSLDPAIHTGRPTQLHKPAVLWGGDTDPARQKCLALIACAALAPTLSFASPLVFEEAATITTPDPAFRFPLRVAVEDDTIIATGVMTEANGDIQHHAAFLFRRQSDGVWVYVNKLAETSCDAGEGAEDTCMASVAIRNGVAVVAAGGVHVFERLPDGSWIAAPSDGTTGPGEAAAGTGVVLTSETAGCRWDSRIFTKNSAGVWTLVTTIPGPGLPGCDDWGTLGPDVDMSAGNRFIVGYEEPKEVHIYEPSATTWARTATLTGPVNRFVFGEAVAMDDSRAFSSGPWGTPIHAFSRDAGAWVHSTNIAPPDSAQLGVPTAIQVRDLVVAGFPHDPHRVAGSVGVFRHTASGQYEQVARLVSSDIGSEPEFLGEEVAAYVSGSFARIVATTNTERLYVFDLDDWGTTPAPLQEDFEQGNAVNWTPIAGSSFSVATSGGSRVYRQSNTAGGAGSFVTSIDWTDQAIEADVKPTAFDGADRWVGLAVRRTDANNYYYITLRGSNVLALRRIVNGVFVTLASTSTPVVLNRNYRLRLEAVGTLLRVYIEGRLALQAHDTELTHGHAGVALYRTRADFDNVILSQNPNLALLDQRIFRPLEFRWSLGPGVWTDVFTNNQRLVQHDTSDGARAVTLVDAENQIVQTRAFATSFAAGTGSRWFGVMARYSDAGNYYYVTMRADNTISLRKLVNGAIHVLDSAPLTVSTGTVYRLRLEAIGNSLRTYVNGRLVLEAKDASHASGKYGLVTYKTAATYDDFVAREP